METKRNRAGLGLGCWEVEAALPRFVSPETLSLAATHGSAHCRGEEPGVGDLRADAHDSFLQPFKHFHVKCSVDCLSGWYELLVDNTAFT